MSCNTCKWRYQRNKKKVNDLCIDLCIECLKDTNSCPYPFWEDINESTYPILPPEEKPSRKEICIPVLGSSKKWQREQFKKLGFVLGMPHTDDPLWRYATLPEDWKVLGERDDEYQTIKNETGRTIYKIYAEDYQIPYIEPAI